MVPRLTAHRMLFFLQMFDKAEEYLYKSLEIAQELLSNRPEDLELKVQTRSAYKRFFMNSIHAFILFSADE